MANREPSTGQILQQLQQGCEVEANFHRLVQRYYGPVHRFFRRQRLRPEESEELTQTVFLRVYKSIGQVQEVERFESWLFTIAKHTLVNRLPTLAVERQQCSLDEPAGRGAGSLVDRRADPERTLLEQEWLERYYAAWQALPEQMRRCWELQQVDELSYAQMATLLGIGVETVRSHLRQARAALRARLGAEFFNREAKEEP